MTEPRFHRQEANGTEKLLWDWLVFLVCVGVVVFSIYLGAWQPVFNWLAFNWTTIWQVLVLPLLLSGLVGKR